jgi:hypothetical protein
MAILKLVRKSKRTYAQTVYDRQPASPSWTTMQNVGKHDSAANSINFSIVYHFLTIHYS